MTRDPVAAAPVGIDPEHPWLGLSSYTEETRAYFHGRDDETAELARRVQRKNLTVLFGQSGLGKTSLLRAGLVPRLRGEGFCPVYVRVDYSAESPPPSEQIKQAILKATAAAGVWTRPGSAIEGESLWEFLHHRGDLLRDQDGRTLLPLLIFDQFEEIFTLAQADDAGRLRAKRFIEDLADLVENRPPVALEARLDQDEAAAEDYDFARADYRILIALREDYLAHLESLKGVMPSITQNRMRLARMTGEQALSAVMQPGGRLVSQEVAGSIVRFVAGGAELANAEVEPSLLSLVCRELNNVRLAQGRAEISADLLAGSRETILSEFYERAMADQPPGVRRVIEDELLTESGYRESLAEERVSKALAAAGASPDALAKLVDRRLLRIEERLDVRRVELTHDVLCSVVAASRDLRHEREARDEAERQLAAQREREAETHRTLMRTRKVAVVSAVLMLLAAASAVFGWVNYRRAHTADLAAQQARSDAEKLVGFLIEDFYAELEPTGRLETMGKLATLAVDYYDGLPPELLTGQTQVYRGMALIRAGGALLAADQVEAGMQRINQARELFERLQAEGDTSDGVTYGLALALFTPYAAWGPGGGPESRPTDLPRAAELLRPFLEGDDEARQARILYGDVLNYLSHAQEKEQALATCEEARSVLAALGAVTLEDLTAASVYADTADSQARHALSLGRLEDAERLEREVYEIAEGVLAKRPGDIRSMKNRALAADLLGRIAMRRQDFTAAAQYAARSEQAGEDLVRFNPTDLGTWVYWVRGGQQTAQILFRAGQGQRGDRETVVGRGTRPGREAALEPRTGAGVRMVRPRRAANGVRPGDRRRASVCRGCHGDRGGGGAVPRGQPAPDPGDDATARRTRVVVPPFRRVRRGVRPGVRRGPEPRAAAGGGRRYRCAPGQDRRTALAAGNRRRCGHPPGSLRGRRSGGAPPPGVAALRVRGPGEPCGSRAGASGSCARGARQGRGSGAGAGAGAGGLPGQETGRRDRHEFPARLRRGALCEHADPGARPRRTCGPAAGTGRGGRRAVDGVGRGQATARGTRTRALDRRGAQRACDLRSAAHRRRGRIMSIAARRPGSGFLTDGPAGRWLLSTSRRSPSPPRPRNSLNRQRLAAAGTEVAAFVVPSSRRGSTMFLNRPHGSRQGLRHALFVSALGCVIVLGSTGTSNGPRDGLDSATPSPRVTFADAAAGEQRTDDARPSSEKPGSASGSEPPRSPKRHERPRRKKSLELGIGEEEIVFARQLPA